MAIESIDLSWYAKRPASPPEFYVTAEGRGKAGRIAYLEEQSEDASRTAGK